MGAGLWCVVGSLSVRAGFFGRFVGGPRSAFERRTRLLSTSLDDVDQPLDQRISQGIHSSERRIRSYITQTPDQTRNQRLKQPL